MKKMLVMMLLMSFMIVSCNDDGTLTDPAIDDTVTEPIDGNDGDADNDGDETPTTPTTPTTPPSPTSKVPEQARTFKTNVSYMNLTNTQADKYDRAVALVKKVVATEAFRTKILNHKYNGATQFANNNGKTNAQIYQSILDAAEKLTPSKNNTMDVGVKMYYTNNSVVGWTNTSITYINVNTKFFNNYTINNVAANLFHEWLHKVGYGHDSSSTTRRPYSVPYAVGYLIRDIGKSFL